MNFSNLLDGYKPYEDLKKAIEKKKTPVSVSGIVESAQMQLIAQLSQDKNALVVTYTDAEAKLAESELMLYTDKVFSFCEKEYTYYNIDVKDHARELDRLSTLCRIANGGIVTASVEACLQYTLPKEKIESLSQKIKIGDRLDVEALCKKLVLSGYTREDATEGIGQFSLRGGILDVFSPNLEMPYRIEFFDDEVDSIRTFDAQTQRSNSQLDECFIMPARELCLDDTDKEKLVKYLEKSKKKASDKLSEIIDNELTKLAENNTFESIDKYIGVIYETVPTILDYTDEDWLVFIIEPARISERAKTLEWEKSEIITDLLEKDVIIKKPQNMWLPYKDAVKKFSELRLVSLNLLSHSSVDYKYAELVEFVTKTTVSLHGKIDYLYDDLTAWQRENATVLILANTPSKAENLAELLREKGFSAKYEKGSREFSKGEITLLHASVKKGFEYPEIGFVLISEQDIFVRDKKQREKKIDSKRRIKVYTDIGVGDFVVHKAHGIGEYAGIKKMEFNGVIKDYLKIKYHGTDVLYVPVDQMDMLYKYTASGDRPVRLNKLGGGEWSRTKQKVKTAAGDMAKQLVALYAEREHTKGHKYPADTPWQRDFEDTFTFVETPDQIRSIEEVKADMENEKPMDRLLCGDVGYGKTEVALRAAFKAATDSKQVAYLCPTTILAMQHYETFKKRMADFPIGIEMLSRFKTPKEQKEIIKKLKTSEIDIVIGTHRLLQKDVEFRDIGLLIIDEEQRFGVADKERIKELKKSVDVLSMTATPIPRTLHMAMLSVRDMSLLESPPDNRYPVETYVLEYNEDVISGAIKKELARGGQVFYLYNRVQGIYSVAEKIRKMVPDARVAVGHGKMHEDELEDIMYSMVNGDIDILVCTTIIETGLDIPNANTIIIENADKMGLSQLYQLRGRVGRSSRSAYAYMTYKRDGVLTEVAQKRLSAVREFTEFGSGFKIAMRDLEIRGAGNMLGAEQHGHMDAVGYDMYCKLLSESVREAQGLSKEDKYDISIDISIDAYIPEKYIKNADHRIDIYKQIATVVSEDDASDITDELIDRYGEPPKPVMNLIDIAVIKTYALKCGAISISEKPKGMIFTFLKNSITADVAMALIKEMPKNIKIGTGEEPQIIYLPDKNKTKIDNIKFLLQRINGLIDEEK